MKAMVLYDFAKPLALRDIPIPKLGPDDALVKILACGVCRTDTKILRGRLPMKAPLPMTPGHEPAGEVVEVGANVANVRPGDRVTCINYVTCGHCEHCRTGRESICTNLPGQIGFTMDGGFAEYLRAPAVNLLKLPDNVPYGQAAILSDAVATSYHAIRHQAKIQVGETAAVIGIGGVGVHALQLAKLAGARVIAADVRDEALELARQHGADVVVNVQTQDFVAEVRRATGGAGLDLVLDTAGHPAQLDRDLHSLKRGGRLVMIGYQPGMPFPVEPMELVLNEWVLIGTRAMTKQDVAESIQLVADGRINPVITVEYPLERANELIAALEAGKVVGRGVLIP